MAMRIALSATLLGALGCAHDRDWARVDANLARPYAGEEPLIAPATMAARPVEAYGIGPQRSVIQPVGAGAPAPATVSAAPTQAVAPPLSSTDQQPYYVPVSGASSAPPVAQPMTPLAAPAPSAPVIVQTGATAPTGVGAGVYPVPTTGMWTPSSGPANVPPIALQSTGSSFNPRDPAVGRTDVSTGSSMTMAAGQVMPAGAAAPFASAIPKNAPPPTERLAFLSETGEAQQPSRLPPPRGSTESATPLPKDVPERPRDAATPPPAILDEDRMERPGSRPRTNDGKLPNVVDFGEKEMTAPPADPPRGKAKPAPRTDDPLPPESSLPKSKKNAEALPPPPPSEIALPGDDDLRKPSTRSTPKNETKMRIEESPPAKRKADGNSSTKELGDLMPPPKGLSDSGPSSVLPDDPLPPPAK